MSSQKPRGRYNRGRRNLAWICAVLAVSALVVSFGGLSWRQPSTPVRSKSSVGHWDACFYSMKQVTSAAALYSIDHDRQYPENLRDLVPKYISEKDFVRGTRCWRDDSPHNVFIGRSEKPLPLVFCPIHLEDGPCASKVEFLKGALADIEPWKDLHKLDLERELLTCEPDLYFVNAYYPDFLWIQCTGDHPKHRPKTWMGPGHGDI